MPFFQSAAICVAKLLNLIKSAVKTAKALNSLTVKSAKNAAGKLKTALAVRISFRLIISPFARRIILRILRFPPFTALKAATKSIHFRLGTYKVFPKREDDRWFISSFFALGNRRCIALSTPSAKHGYTPGWY